MDIRKVSALFIIGAAIMAPAAHADIISFSATVPPTATDFTGTATLQKFDTTLGTLTNVVFSLGGATSVNYSLTNNSATKTNSYTVQGSATMDFTVPSNNVVEIVPASSKPESSVAPGGTRTGSFTGSASTTYTEAPANFSLYTATGFATFDNNYTVTGVSGALGPAPFAFSATQTGNATFTVTYTYTKTQTVPEPTSLALVSLSGFGMLGGILRRRKA